MAVTLATICQNQTVVVIYYINVLGMYTFYTYFYVLPRPVRLHGTKWHCHLQTFLSTTGLPTVHIEELYRALDAIVSLKAMGITRIAKNIK